MSDATVKIKRRRARRPASASSQDAATLENTQNSEGRPAAADASSGAGATSDTDVEVAHRGAAAAPRQVLPSCYDDGQFSARVGPRMRFYRLKCGVPVEMMVTRTTLHSVEAYMRVERGESPLELWAPLIGIFAVNLGVACKYLNPSESFPDLPQRATAAAAPSKDEWDPLGPDAGPAADVRDADNSADVEAVRDETSPPTSPVAQLRRANSVQPQPQPQQRLSFGKRVKQLRCACEVPLAEMLRGIPEEAKITLEDYASIENGSSIDGFERWAFSVFAFAETTRTPIFNLLADASPVRL